MGAHTDYARGAAQPGVGQPGAMRPAAGQASPYSRSTYARGTTPSRTHARNASMHAGSGRSPWGLVLALVIVALAIAVAAGAFVVLHFGSPATPTGAASQDTLAGSASNPNGPALVGASSSAGSAAPAGAIDPAPAGTADTVRGLAPVVRERTYSRVTLSAVGDNLMNMPVVYAADANAGEMGDGWYDFTPMYAGVADILASHDLNFIDIETILGGDHLGLSGYPSFNSPSVIAEQVAASGWNLVTTAMNHSWDMGLEGIQNSSATWAAQPGVLATGTFTSPEDRSTIRTVERGGIRFAFLAYTDYLNGLVLPDDQWWAVATADADAMAADVERARTQEGADVVIVAMSWGDENATAPNDTQYFYAQTLADLGVDLVIGFGPHVIQPIEWVAGLDVSGAPTGHQTLVVYSLGNFLSNQPLAIENVEGCFTCTFERLGDEGPVSIVDPTWTPLVNHIDGSWHQVFKLSDYTPELAAAHDSIGYEADPLGYAYQLTQDIIGPSGIPIAA